jgi:hypothetical protein
MTPIVKFKFSPGDKVVLTRVFYGGFSRRDDWSDEEVETMTDHSYKEYCHYIIQECHYDIHQDAKVRKYYSLKEDPDFFSKYKKPSPITLQTQIDEADIQSQPGKACNPWLCEYEWEDIEGNNLNIGDEVIVDVVYKYPRYMHYRCNPTFTFSGIGIITDFKYCRSAYGLSYDTAEILYKRTCICEDENGNPYRDARAYGFPNRTEKFKVIKTLPKDYPFYFVRECLGLVDEPGNFIIQDKINPLESEYAKEIKLWLSHFGVYERVREIYIDLNRDVQKMKEVEKRQKLIDKLDETIKEQIKDMSEEEKKELLERIKKELVKE